MIWPANGFTFPQLILQCQSWYQRSIASLIGANADFYYINGDKAADDNINFVQATEDSDDQAEFDDKSTEVDVAKTRSSGGEWHHFLFILI